MGEQKRYVEDRFGPPFGGFKQDVWLFPRLGIEILPDESDRIRAIRVWWNVIGMTEAVGAWSPFVGRTRPLDPGLAPDEADLVEAFGPAASREVDPLEDDEYQDEDDDEEDEGDSDYYEVVMCWELGHQSIHAMLDPNDEIIMLCFGDWPDNNE